MNKNTACFIFFILMASSFPSYSKDLNPSNYQQTKSKKNYSFEWNQLKNENTFQTISSFPTQDWWKQFNDPYLNEYIEKAITNNTDYLIAKTRIDQAKYKARRSLAQEFPVVEIGGDFTRQRNSENLTSFPISELQGGGPRIFAPGQTVNIYNTPLSVNYELDPFFKKRLNTKSKQSLTQSAEWQARSVFNTLIAEVASSYFNLISTEEQINHLKQITELDEDNIKLYEVLYSAGLIAQDEVNEAKKLLEQNQEQLNSLKNTKEFFYNNLAFLMGEAPAEVNEIKHLKLAELKTPEVLSTGLASELLFRRPDIVAAEYDLKSAGINVSAARRAYFPSFNLAMQAGFSSINLGNLVSPESLLVALTASTVQTIFSAGQRRADLNIAKAQKEEALHYYQKTILQSFKEVENVLASYKESLKNNEVLNKQLNLQLDNLKLFQAKYDQGLIPYQDLIMHKKKFINLQKSLNENQASLLINQISLYKALGSGQV
ncbi:MAG: efflux transporter outer membrane subunit [Candidatus Melainabacteria bacterium]|jgi:NodT family efflux transporter outer membrane factor (OMF) lipoprotein